MVTLIITVYLNCIAGADPDFEVGGVMGMAVGHSPRGSGGMLPRKKIVNQR